MKAGIPSHRVGELIEVADLVLFLASLAANFIWGQVVRSEGGRTAV